MGPGWHMGEETAGQPSVIDRLLYDGAAEIGAVAAALRRRRPRFVLFAARGTSDHAAFYGKYLAEIQLGLPAGLVSPSGSTVYGAGPDLREVLFIAVSQSGGSPDLLDSLTAAHSCGAATLDVMNNSDSTLAGAAEYAIDVRAGLERAVAATKSYVAELVALWLLIVGLAERPTPAAAPLADAARRTLDGTAPVAEVAAARYRFADRIVTTGLGYSYPSARGANSN